MALVVAFCTSHSIRDIRRDNTKEYLAPSTPTFDEDTLNFIKDTIVTSHVWDFHNTFDFAIPTVLACPGAPVDRLAALCRIVHGIDAANVFVWL